MSTTTLADAAEVNAPDGLQFVEPSAAFDTANFLLYGAGGSGKTMAATSAPGPVLVLSTEGPGGLAASRALGRDIREVRFDGPSTLKPFCQYVQNGAGGARTVVLDTVGGIHRTLLEILSGGKAQVPIQTYGQVNKTIAELVRFLRDKPVNLVLVCHERIDDQEGDRIVRPLTGGQQLPELLIGEVDVAAYCATVPPTEDHPRRWMGQLVEANGRRAKDRSGALGDVRELDLTEWLQAYREALGGGAA